MLRSIIYRPISSIALRLESYSTHSSTNVQASPNTININDVVLTHWAIRAGSSIPCAWRALTFRAVTWCRNSTRHILARAANSIPCSNLSHETAMIRTTGSKLSPLVSLVVREGSGVKAKKAITGRWKVAPVRDMDIRNFGWNGVRGRDEWTTCRTQNRCISWRDNGTIHNTWAWYRHAVYSPSKVILA